MFAFEGFLTILMFAYVVFLGFIKISDTSLPIGTLDVLNIVCLLAVVKSYTLNCKILRRLENVKLTEEKHFKETQKTVSEGFKKAENNILGASLKTGLSIKNINSSVSSLSGIVSNMSLQGDERLGRAYPVGLEIC